MSGLKFSLITPTHSPKFLKELYASIKKQTYKNWEWIIYTNNGVTAKDIPYDKYLNVRVYSDDGSSEFCTNVGYLKKEAFSKGSGDVLVEVDHDDLLHPNCLDE